MSIDVPALLGRGADTAHVGRVARREDHAIGLRGNDGRRFVEAAGLDHQRARQVGLDQGGGNARDFLPGERLDANAWAELDCPGSWGRGRRARRGRFRAADGQGAARTIEHDHVTGVDQVWIADLLAVEIPDFGPPPRRIGEALGDVPQGIAAHHDIAVRRVRLEGDRALRNRRGLCRSSDQGQSGKGKNERCDKLTQLVVHGAPEPYPCSRAGLKSPFAIQM